ncbi:regulator of chromosome condensation 1/beta-lactamase-inhibitor protein II [Phascolomyces articulosus]|uniref:Regulator of chromosome condensation 1/beta-lactamase-inhibitor protein II n=1 Tax=Phascolomyces articulosus TaxID=60185 RepID=A0AAD5K194_9FUNG|nr:regulator of chromosome condensation 1/beta-lactamase-inhibitor protein II [Phascolomyces articulosus]
MWGWKPECQGNDFLQIWGNLAIKRMFGSFDQGWIGALGDDGIVWYYQYGSKERLKLTTGAKDADYCQDRKEILVLTETGYIDCYEQRADDDKLFAIKKRLANLPKVHAMAVSFSHVLFYTEGLNPIYVLGSNRYSQLGFDTTIQSVGDESIIPVEFFSGLMVQQASLACGPFHSAVVVDGELYTFGWKKNGRLGWGNSFTSQTDDHDDVIGLVEFRNEQGELVEDVYVIKVVCGTNHTMALDDEGRVWTCGSNQYKQLGRATQDDIDGSTFDDVFRLCTAYTGFAIDCYAGRWNSFIITQPHQ